MSAVRIAMPGFCETVEADDRDTVASVVHRATAKRGSVLPRHAMFFVNGQRVDPEATIDPTEDATVTVASRAKNG